MVSTSYFVLRLLYRVPLSAKPGHHEHLENATVTINEASPYLDLAMRLSIRRLSRRALLVLCYFVVNDSDHTL